ncbi:MAG: DNA repair protein RecN [Propionibacteriaceae bacterium]|jgi:DNA repair protein RecN (Recombination protein N)|nr:DNA repair protein RecN [Propionibacteriaceae bacterium]
MRKEPLIFSAQPLERRIGRSSSTTSCNGRPVHLQDVVEESHPARRPSDVRRENQCILNDIRINNVGVIAEAALQFAPGLTAVTGETGAGKTMVVTGLGLLLGERADASVVRHGEQRSLVEGRFIGVTAVAELLTGIGALLDDGDELLVSRQVQAGRSRAVVGGVQTPVATLNAIVSDLATIHGQSEQLLLASSASHREMLDRAAGERLTLTLREYRQLYQERAVLQAELHELRGNARERARELDLLQFGLAEISALRPTAGEDVSLAAEAQRLQAMDDLRLLATDANHALSGADDGDWSDPGAVGSVGRAKKAILQLATLDPGATALAAAVTEVAELLNDLAAEVASYLSNLEADPIRLEFTAARRAELATLTKKYGATVDEVLAWEVSAAKQVLTLGTSDERSAAIEAEVMALGVRLAELAATLSVERTTAAQRLAAAVATELTGLAMPHAQLRFVLTALPELGPYGAENVQLLFSANPGSELAPLAKVASGGELSRIRLALEVALAIPGNTFVFDEIDAGVGGAVGFEIGARLARLARTSQVIVVTHLAQVAVFADRQWVITKADDGEVTTSDITEVVGAARVAEIARMMGGDTNSAAALTHASELLARAAKR